MSGFSDFPTLLIAAGAGLSAGFLLIAAVCEDLFHGALLLLVLLFTLSLIFL